MIVGFLAVSFIAVFTIALSAHYYYTKATTKDFYNIAQGSSASLNNQLDRYFKQMAQSTYAMIAGPLRDSSDPLMTSPGTGIIQQWLSGKVKLTSYNKLLIEDLFRRYITLNYSEIESLVLMSVEGGVISSDGQSGVTAHSQEPWFILPFDRTTQVIPTHLSQPNRVPVVSLLIPIYSTNNVKIVGRLVINLSLNVFSEIMGKTMIGETGYFFILSSDNTIVFHPDSLLQGIKLTDSPISHLQILEPNKQQRVENQDYLTTYTQSDFTSWKVAAVVPLNEMATGLNVARDSIIMVVLLLLSFVILIVPLFTKLLVDPIIKLKKMMQEVQRGNLAVKADFYPGQDELQILGSSFNKMIIQLNALIDKVYRFQLREMSLELKQKDAMIQALQNQINPHFLYNSLDIIKSIAFLEEVPKIEKMVSNLAAFFRYTAKLDKIEVNLGDELNHLKTYLEIIHIRFTHNFQSQNFVNEKFLNVSLVKLTLQPIVENAVKYAVERNNGNATIIISAYNDQDDLIIEVVDNGPGMEEDRLLEIQQNMMRMAAKGELIQPTDSLGLANVHARLVLQYGFRYGLTLTSFLGRGTIVSIRIPIKKVKSDNDS
ncbi:cache domain-containing sensor histidine kinase [Paenibacillus luteus]|uniref:cache domain-containing sensor histidine kinase n=1 Tax=Paenibacillus luteus TaxID=2545753 RepID=UPI0019D61FA6|nr:sensor histidine kinase [Paenibacillus luteus]